MKISRKAIAAVVATFALSTAGLSGTAFAEPTTITCEAPKVPNEAGECVDPKVDPGSGDTGNGEGDTETDDSSSTGSSEGFVDGSSDDDGNIDPKAISSWIAVFTAIIGALSTAFVFSQRIANA